MGEILYSFFISISAIAVVERTVSSETISSISPTLISMLNTNHLNQRFNEHEKNKLIK